MEHYNKTNRREFLKNMAGIGLLAGLWGINKRVNSEPDATEYKVKDWYEIEIKPNAPDKTVYNEFTQHTISGISWDEYLEMVYEKNNNKNLEGKIKLPIFEVNDEGEK